MKTRVCSICSVILAVMLCISVMPGTALASAAVSAVIPVSVSVLGEEGTGKEDIPEETYTFVLRAKDGAPMPKSDTLKIRGEGSGTFEIDYSNVGVYRYTLEQDASALTGANSICDGRGTYDRTVYEVTVTITNAESGGYAAVVAAHRSGREDVKTDLVFVNRYAPVPVTTTEETTAKTTEDTTQHETTRAEKPTEETTAKTTEDTTQHETTRAKKPTKDETGTTTAARKRTDDVKTGDNSRTFLWFGLLVGAAAALVLILLFGRKKK